MSRDVPGKVIAMFVGVVSFVATGVDHCMKKKNFLHFLLGAANVGFFSIGIIHQVMFDEGLNVRNLNLSNAILWNIVPTGVGNIIGSFIFVSVTYSFIFSSKHVVAKLAKQNGVVSKPKKNNFQTDDQITLNGSLSNIQGDYFKSPLPQGQSKSRVLSRATSRINSRVGSRDFSKKQYPKFTNNTFNKDDINTPVVSEPSSSNSLSKVSRSVDHTSKVSSPRNFAIQSPVTTGKNFHFGSLDNSIINFQKTKKDVKIAISNQNNESSIEKIQIEKSDSSKMSEEIELQEIDMENFVK